MEYTRNLPVKSRKGLDKIVVTLNQLNPWNLNRGLFQKILWSDVLETKYSKKLLELYDILNDISTVLMTENFTDDELAEHMMLLDTLCADIDDTPDELAYYYNVIGCMLACLRNNMMAEGLDIDEKNIVVMWLVALMRLVWRTIGKAEVEEGEDKKEEKHNEEKRV